MYLTIDRLDEVGNITDVPAWATPPNAVTFTKNVVFDDGAVRKSRGWALAYDAVAAQAWLQDFNDNARQRLMYITDEPRMFDFNADGSEVDISPAVAMNSSIAWDSMAYSDHVIITNSIDEPHYYNDLNNDPAAATFVPLSAVSDWPSDWSCKQIRWFNNVLIALNLEKGGVENPNLVQWSDIVAEDEAPPSWDETDPTKLAGSNLVGANDSPIVGGEQLRDAFIIYTNTSAYSMTRSGDTTFLYNFRKLFSHGMSAPHGVVQFNMFHFVVGDGLLYAHDGNRVTYVADHKINNKFFNDVTDLNHLNITNDRKNGNVLVAYSDRDDEADPYPNRVLIWNYRDDTWSFQDLGGTRFVRGLYGPVATGGGNTTWNNVDPAGLQWNQVQIPWSGTAPSQEASFLHFGTRTTAINRVQRVFLRNNANYDAEANRQYIDLTDLIKDGGTGVRHIKRMVPKIEGEGTVLISAGVSMAPGIPMTWTAPVPFVIESDYKVDLRISGRYLGWRIQSVADGYWSLTSIGLDIEDASER